jgi:hypothetical protein
MEGAQQVDVAQLIEGGNRAATRGPQFEDALFDFFSPQRKMVSLNWLNSLNSLN